MTLVTNLLSGTTVVINEKIQNPDLIDFLTNSLRSNRRDRFSARELLLHRFITNLPETCHGTIQDLIKVQRHYTTSEIKGIFLKLLKVLPTISNKRFIYLTIIYHIFS